jgi:hypothetical protein
VEELRPRIDELLNEFADHLESSGAGFKDADLEKDLRGPHNKSYDGYDRNNKTVSSLPLFERSPPQFCGDRSQHGRLSPSATKLPWTSSSARATPCTS